MSGPGFPARQSLQDAEMAFAKPAVRYDTAPGFAYSRTRGAISALQIACIHGVEMLAREALSNCFGLRFAQFIQRDIDMALDATFRIPRSFTMADHHQPGVAHRGGPSG